MRRFHDPGTLLLAAGIASAAGSIGGGIGAQREAEAEASFLEAQAVQEETAKRRDLRDLEKEKGRHLARTRALLAAQGGGGGTGVHLLKSQASEFGRQAGRINFDAETSQRSLQTRARNVRASGRHQRNLGFLQAGADLATGGAGFLRSRPITATTSTQRSGRPRRNR